MKILLVAHGYPPEDTGGAELYAEHTAREFAVRGHDVAVLAPTARGGAADHTIAEERRDGVRVLRLTNRYRELFDLSWTYANPNIDRVVADLLDRERPDVVHVHHAIGTTANIVALARQRGATVVVTLHDFWFQCPRGQRLTPRGHLCTRVEPWRCALCIGNKRLSYSGRFAAGWLDGRHPSATGSVTSRAVRLPFELARHAWRELGPSTIRRRLDHMSQALGAADLLLAPSRFLLEEYAQWGLPRERLVHSEYGMDVARFAGQTRRVAEDGRIRFAFVGSLQPSKGVDLLVRAFQAIPAERARLDVHGAPTAAAGAAFQRRLERLDRRSQVEFHGRFDNAAIGAILASTDVLVVPSRWYENAPLTLLESVLAGIASITTGHGGMREFAESYGTAVTFAPDDAEDLTRALRRFVDDPGLAQRLGASPRRAVRTIEDDVDALLCTYERLRASR